MRRIKMDGTCALVLGAALAAAASAQVPIGSLQCAGEPNSTGARATLLAFGDVDPTRNDLWLRAEHLPLQAIACGLVGRDGAHTPLAGSMGTLCLGAGFGRLSNQIAAATSTGKAVLHIDLTQLPGPMGSFAVVRGDTLRFQVWYRDVAVGGVATANLTDAVTVTFAPRPWFEGEGTYVGDFYNQSIEVRDVDQDGFGDALVPSATLGGLTACLGRGDGSFEPAILLSEIAQPQAVFPLQLDGDGVLDYLVTTSNSGGETELVRGSLPLGPRPAEAAPFSRAGVVAIVDDRDGDGAADAVLVDRNTLRAVLYHGDGLGDFVEVAQLPPAVLWSRGVFRDVDGDGDRDVLLWLPGGHDVQVVRDLGGGAYSSAGIVPFPSSSLALTGTVTDLDADGFPDIAASGSGFVSVRRNRGDGTFGLEARYDSPSHMVVVDARDADGDQDVDLLVAGYSANVVGGSNVLVMENLGQGVLRAGPAPVAAVRGWHGTLRPADLDGLGALDLVGIDSDQDAIFGTLATGAASFAPPVADTMQQIHAGIVRQVELGDFDGDGDEECLALSYIDPTWGALTVLEVGPTGPTNVGCWRFPNFTSYACADFDGDGRDDIVYPTTSGMVVASLQAPGQLAPFGPAVAGLPGLAVPADLDGDGDVDVVAWQGTGSADLLIGENVGGGILVPRPGRIPPSPTNAQPSSVTVADMDGDGDLDLVAVRGTSNWVRVYDNVGGATFAARPDVMTSGWVSRPEAVDLDGDGDTDVVAFAWQSPRDFLWNDGNGGLTVTSPVIHAHDVGSFADFDGDGDADFVFASKQRRFARIVLSDGRGELEGQVVLTLGQNNNFGTGASIRSGDLDGDGDRDLVLLLENKLDAALIRIR